MYSWNRRNHRQGTNVTIDRYIANSTTMATVLSELLMYCYFGQEYTHYGERVADAAYAAPWYRCSPTIRPYYCMLMRQAQRPRFFVGFQMVNCSLQNFTSVWIGRGKYDRFNVVMYWIVCRFWIQWDQCWLFCARLPINLVFPTVATAVSNDL